MEVDGSIDIYDRKIVDEILKLIDITDEFDSLGCYNIFIATQYLIIVYKLFTLVKIMIRGTVQKGAPIAKMVADAAEKISLGDGGAFVVKKRGRKPGAVINRNQLGQELY